MSRFLLILVLGCTLHAHAQRIPIGIRVGCGFGFTAYNGATRHYFSNTPTLCSMSFLTYRGLFIGSVFTSPFSRLRDSLTLYDVTHAPHEKLSLELKSWIVGYSIRLPDQRLSIDPYIGMVKTYIQNDNGKTSYASQMRTSVGAFVYFYSEPTLKAGKYAGQWFWFVHNRLDIAQLNKLNPQLGSMQYSIQVGFGLHWGNIKDYWRLRY